MNTVKQLTTALVVFLFLLVGVGLVPSSSTSAQVRDKLMLAVIPYEPLQNLDFFFLHSVHPLHFVESTDPKRMSKFVSIITPEQQNEYENAGYKPIIIDENPGTIEQYYLLYSRRHNTKNVADQLQDPAMKQQGLEIAYQLSPYTALLKVTYGTSFSQLDIPALTHYAARQLHRDLVPPTGRTSINVQPSVSPTMRAPQTQTSETDQRWIALLVFGAIGIFLFVTLRKNPHN